MDEPDITALGSAPGSVVAFRQQVHVLQRQWRWIAGSAALAALLAAAFSTLRPVRYESTATVGVFAARLADGLLRLPPDGFVPLMTSPVVVADVAKLLSLDPQGVEAVVTVRAVPESTMIRVSARMSTQADAAKTANTYASVATEAANKMYRSDAEVVDAEMKAEVAAAAARMTTAEQALEAFQQTAQIDALEREVETLLNHRTDLMYVTVDLEAEKARLSKVEDDAAKQPAVTELRQSVVDDPTMAATVRSAEPGTDPRGLQMTRQVLNGVSLSLKEEASSGRAKVAELDRRRTSLASAGGGKALERLNELYRRKSRHDRLEAELEVARKAFTSVSERYQNARVAAIARTPQLRVVDPALAPHVPLGRYLLRNSALGLAAGGLLACAFVLLRAVLMSPSQSIR